jgi:hypothetical protein
VSMGMQLVEVGEPILSAIHGLAIDGS